jgi:release factor glutamine methyltransferase
MTVRDALQEGAAALSGTETPFLDASLLLAAALGMDTARLLASSPDSVPEASLATFRSSLAARSGGLSVAYILGFKEFWGRRFHVDPRVLVPRPDTETLVAAALKLGDTLLREREEKNNASAKAQSSSAESAKDREDGRFGMREGFINHSPQSPNHDFSSADSAAGSPRLRASSSLSLRVHDACTGSGCVAISIAADRSEWSLSASDLSEDALVVAAENAAALLGPGAGAEDRPGGALSFSRGDLLVSASGPFDLITANPPYVGSVETDALLGLGWSEPRLALDGGADGLDLVRRLVPEAFSVLAPGGALLVEADGEQADAVAKLFRASRFIEIETICDLGGRPRVTSGRKPWTI